jgi:hypothetical protein
LAQCLHPTCINHRNVGDFGARSRENGMALPISFDKNGDLLTT